MTWAAVVLVVAALGWLIFARGRAVATAVVEAGDIEQRVIARAVVVPAGGVVHVRSSAGGTVREVRMGVGARVMSGVVLATLALESTGETARVQTVEAPAAGTILARHVAVGEAIPAAGVVLFEMADLRKIEARIEVEEGDAASVQFGRAVELRRRGGGAVVGRGAIEREGPAMERRQIGVNDARVRGDGSVRPAWVGIDGGAALAVLVGEELEAVIAMPARKAAARVPRGAVRIEEGEAFVEVAGGVFARRVKVGIGVSDERFVEVTGIEAGVRVNVR